LLLTWLLLAPSLLSLLLLTLARARRARLHGAALSLPLRRLGALLCSLAARRSRLLLARTVVLAGLAVRPLLLLARRGAAGRPACGPGSAAARSAATGRAAARPAARRRTSR